MLKQTQRPSNMKLKSGFNLIFEGRLAPSGGNNKTNIRKSHQIPAQLYIKRLNTHFLLHLIVYLDINLNILKERFFFKCQFLH